MLCSVRGEDLSVAMVRAGWAVAWCSFLEKLRPQLLAGVSRRRGRGARGKARDVGAAGEGVARLGLWPRNRD
jgi:endonuclease YncB( thermonuclease family)